MNKPGWAALAIVSGRRIELCGSQSSSIGDDRRRWPCQVRGQFFCGRVLIEVSAW